MTTPKPDAGGEPHVDAATGTADDTLPDSFIDSARKILAAAESVGMTLAEYARAFNELTPEQIRTAMEPKPDAGGPESKLTHCSGCGAAYSPANPCWDDDGLWDEDGIECHRNGKCKACAARNCREREVAACAEWLISHGYVFAGERLRRDRPTPEACPLEQEVKRLQGEVGHALIAGAESTFVDLEAENAQLRAQLAESEESLRLEHEAFEQYMEVGERAREERDSLRAQLAEAREVLRPVLERLKRAQRVSDVTGLDFTQEIALLARLEKE